MNENCPPHKAGFGFAFNGGGGGGRTPVRKHFNGTFSGRRRLLRESSSLFPFQTANRHAVRSGELHDVWHGQSLPYAHLPLNDALPGSRSFQVGRLPLIRQQQQQCCCYLIYKVARFMAVRRRRPLVPPPYPRRNRYTPLSSGQTALTPFPWKARGFSRKLRIASLPLLFQSQTLRWFPIGFLEFWQTALGYDWISEGSVHRNILRDLLSEIITHFAVEMCYDSVTFLILIRFLRI